MKRLLVANRGEIALRIIRACRELGIATVAVHSDVDRGAAYVRAADQAVALPGVSAAETYLDVERIVAAARHSGADAVHPGYGFLSERPVLVRACALAGLTFVGPPAGAMEQVGDKQAARRAMVRAGVPVVPGSPEGARTDAELVAAAPAVGFPLLVKAVHGGGGKGMRLVADPKALPEALAAARREAQAAFGDGAVYLERAIVEPRHVEVQILADAHGNVVALGERECSVQRRHQKVLEESPSPAVDPELRRRLYDAAIRAARQVGYVNAGTVEFLVSGRELYFLEVNARLQVEHPVTELVTGVDLVHAQLAVARGERLAFAQDDVVLRGHALEARLYAEDPAHGFVPATGRIAHLRMPEGPGVRVDRGIVEGDEVSVHYDPMLAKLVVHAETRTLACRRMQRALEACEVLGVITNQRFLRRLVSHPAFVAGELHTGFIAQHAAELDAPYVTDPAVHAVAAALAAAATQQRAQAQGGAARRQGRGDAFSPWRAS